MLSEIKFIKCVCNSPEIKHSKFTHGNDDDARGGGHRFLLSARVIIIAIKQGAHCTRFNYNDSEAGRLQNRKVHHVNVTLRFTLLVHNLGPRCIPSVRQAAFGTFPVPRRLPHWTGCYQLTNQPTSQSDQSWNWRVLNDSNRLIYKYYSMGGIILLFACSIIKLIAVPTTILDFCGP